MFISINLGILNLLPIPVLDGGQAVIYAIEGMRRAPLSLRTREIVSQLGLTRAAAADGPRVLERSLAPVDEPARLARERVTRVPLLLAVETATAAPSVALWRGDALLGERAADPGRATAEALLPALDALLADARVALAAVEGFAVSIGPGSFTGLRIGVATVKGLAFGTARPAVAVSTLAALARHAPGPAPVAAVLDARRGEVYAAGFAARRAGPLAPGGRGSDRGARRRGCRPAAAWWARARRCARRRCAARTSCSCRLPIRRRPRATSRARGARAWAAARRSRRATSCRATCAARRPR